jgi:glycosyltransferase involved in cell wall biosynthesis
MPSTSDPLSNVPHIGHPGRPLRIFWLTSSASTDGPGRALLALLNGWHAEDVVAVATIRDVSTAFRDACRPGVVLDAMRMRGLMDLGTLARLIRRCRLFRPDVIHTQLSRADWIGRLVGARLGVPVVSTVHNVHSRMYPAEFAPVLAWLGATLDRATARFATHVVAVSEGVQRDLVANGVPSSRVTIVPNAVDTSTRAAPLPRADVRRAWNAAPNDIVVGTVALLKTQKGLDCLVDAARTVLQANPRVRFVQIGDGPLESDIRARVAAAGIAGRFRMLGHVPDPVALLPGLDMFVLPSRWEGLPVALLEAMAAGLPAIGTRVSGIEEVIDDRRTGLLVPPADRAALAEAILELAADAELGRRLARAAVGDLGRFAPARVATAYRQVYVQVLTPGAVGVARDVGSARARSLSKM